ncbi:MAG: hypothetical protein IJK86_08710 [Lachnospiraceae bacterium]|nr:hypothetical protein [Lachnospiraceae bacterium]
MELIYHDTYLTETTDLDMFGRLRPARLLELVQTVSGRHAAALGLGGDVLDSRGLAWVVVRQKIEISRMPGGGETLLFTTWPGRGMHGLFPRYMEIGTPDGESLIRLCFLWVIMDRTSRVMIQPKNFGLDMPYADREPLLPLPRLPKQLPPAAETAEFTVPYSYIDVNGHMNNTRYLELAENLIPAPREGLRLRSLLIEFTHELKLGETMHLAISRDASLYTLHGTRGSQDIITLCLQF